MSSQQPSKFRLEISLARVQTFIFEVPRLKAMLGANALLGNSIRHELTRRLLKGSTLLWPQQVKLPDTGNVDPLNMVDGIADDRDDPVALYRKGILARDGGHFIALFDHEEDAKAFQDEAAAFINSALPGVKFTARISSFPEKKSNSEKGAATGETCQEDTPEDHLMDLPIFQLCEETGNQPAAKLNQEKWQAASVVHRYEWGEKFYENKTRDIVGLLHKKIYPRSRGNRPDDLNDLASGGYLAVIHADGNNIGSRYKQHRESTKAQHANGASATDFAASLAMEASGEAFFYSMRAAVRSALVEALNNTFPALPEDASKATRPYEILMLGGDDLLMVCHASYALEFCEAYVKSLQKKDHYLIDGQPLHLGIGVAITKPGYPFHQLHRLAEELASSAKLLYRAQPANDKSSVIDWQIITQSFCGSIAKTRQSEIIAYQQAATKTRLLLSQRPYPVLTKGPSSASLEALLTITKSLDEEKNEAARSPLRALRAACEQGKLAAEMAFCRLPKNVQDLLGKDFWHEITLAGDNTNKTYLTRVLDIVGLREIRRLGKPSLTQDNQASEGKYYD